MSKMGQAIMDIQGRYYEGQDPQDIAKQTGTTLSFVMGLIKELDDSDGEMWSYPEPEGDF